MRVAFIFISMPVGGAEDFALSVGRYFPQEIEPVFVCLRTLGVIGEELQAKGQVHLVRAAPGKRLNVFGIMRLAKWLKANRIDLVHCQTYHAHLYGVAAARLAGIPAVVHQQKTLAQMRWHRKWLMHIAVNQAAHLLALSSKTKQDLEAAFSLASNKISVVPNAVDRQVFVPVHDSALAKAQLGLGPEFLFGAVASLNAVKNHEATIRAYADLKKRGCAFRGVFIGEGAARPELQAEIDQNGLQPWVQLVGNKRPVVPWLQALDLLVLPSHWEGQPMILLQALSCGVPIIASRIEGNIAALGNDHPGLFDLKDEARYADLMQKAVADSNFRQEILDCQQALPIPDASQVAVELASLYRQLAL